MNTSIVRTGRNPRLNAGLLLAGPIVSWVGEVIAAAPRWTRSYSPYDNVGTKAYPAMLVTTGLWDSQVQYFEPAKWVAKLRALRTNDAPLLFHVNMEAGHGGKSGRYQRMQEIAREYGFIIALLAGKLASPTHPHKASRSLNSAGS